MWICAEFRHVKCVLGLLYAFFQGGGKFAFKVQVCSKLVFMDSFVKQIGLVKAVALLHHCQCAPGTALPPQVKSGG